jgi:hypothetical protein
MARKLVTVEISLVNCTLQNTAGGGKESSHLVQSLLVWPRAGIASRLSASRVDLVAGECDLSRESWTRRIVFKESVEATFGIRIEITEALGGEALEEFLRFMAGVVLRMGADVVDDMVPAGDLAAAPLDYLAARIKKIPDAAVIASASADVSVSSLPAKGEQLISLPLSAPREVVQRSRRTVNRKTRMTRKVLLKKGESNGTITLSIRCV